MDKPDIGLEVYHCCTWYSTDTCDSGRGSILDRGRILSFSTASGAELGPDHPSAQLTPPPVGVLVPQR